MKRKITAMLLGTCIAALLGGCTKKSLSNEYINIAKYQGLEVAGIEEKELTDEMVEAEIEYKLSDTAVVEEITDRAAKEGDLVKVDYSGKVDGKKFSGNSSIGVTLELGSDELFEAQGKYKSFAAQLTGHKTGDEFEVTVQLPKDYQDEKVAGKEAKFAVTLQSITVSEVPKLTDKWVQANSEDAKTVKEYKKFIKKELEKKREEKVKLAMRSRILAALLDQVEVKEYPKERVKAKVKVMKDYYQGLADSSGMQFGEYAEQYMGMTEEEFTKEAQKIAKKAVKAALACELIAGEKGINLSDGQREMEQYAVDNGYANLDELLKQVEEGELRSTILQEKVADYLIEKCVQTEEKTPLPEEESDE